MRLLQVSLRSMLAYSLLVVVISVPVSMLSIRKIVRDEVDESLLNHRKQFLTHIKNFEYLEDLETDLKVLDQLTYDITITPGDQDLRTDSFQTIIMLDSAEDQERPFRELTSHVEIKGKKYLLTIRESLVGNDELIIVIGSVQAVLIVLLTFGLVLINRSLSQRLWKPFYNTLQQLKAYKIDKNESIVAEKTNIIEFEDLNDSINHLTNKNRKVFLQQKEFIENASHELQTPLAIFQSKLDLLMQSPELKESEATTLLELEETAQRMTRLNNHLLLLTKIENEQFISKEQVELSEVINSLTRNLKIMADQQEIKIHTSLESLTIQANKTLIEVLVTNLLNNAIRHTEEKGDVLIVLAGRMFTISNSGHPVKMDVSKMFDRFSKESRNPASSGLGLAIVKQICDTCAYTLAYTYQDNRHTFSITF